jgi:hypothetical protein
MDEDFEHWPRQRSFRHGSRVELDGQIRFRLAVGVELKIIGAQCRLDCGTKRPQNAVVVNAR